MSIAKKYYRKILERHKLKKKLRKVHETKNIKIKTV
jgi:hypothetical protein